MLSRLGLGGGFLDDTETSKTCVHSRSTMYQYRPLPANTCIRLLIREEQDDPLLKVSLKTVDLSHNTPAYHALSYTWGNPHATGSDLTDYFKSVADEYSAANRIAINCDGQTIHVQQNLYDALRQLTTTSTTTSAMGTTSGSDSDKIIAASGASTNDADTYIWIDAICINQQDPDERASQVKLMDRIYSQATYTIIWLGRDDATKSAAAAAEAVMRISSYPHTAFSQSAIVPFTHQDSEIYRKAGLEPPMTWDHWRSLAALLKRQWFKRVWIVQECILSRDLIMFCGPHRIPWRNFVTAMQNIEARCAAMGSRSPSVDFLELGEVAVPLEHNPFQLATWREYHYHHYRHHGSGLPMVSGQRQFTLEMLIRNTWAFHATNPRDKIYGVLGLLDPILRRSWLVDYGQSVEEVYAYATRRILEQSKSLEILSCIQDPSVRTTVSPRPSWVPDYGIPYVNMLCNNGYFSVAGQRPDADHFQSLVTWVHGRRDRLRLKQVAVFDIIAETANDRQDDIPNSMMLLDPSWFELAILLPQPYHGTGQSRGEALWRTLCADQDPSHKSPAPAEFGGFFQEMVAAMVLVQADLEAEIALGHEQDHDGVAPIIPNCSSSFSEALQWAKTRWTGMGWDDLSVEQLVALTGSPPRLLGDHERYGWLVFTLLKMQILAKTEVGHDHSHSRNKATPVATAATAETAIPDWDFLEKFAREPTYNMRSKHATGERSLNAPPVERRGFFDSFRQRYGKRKLFYTKRGYLGLGPASAKVGDVVSLIKGADGPFVCRRVTSEQQQQQENDTGSSEGVPRMLQIIGESYVHGIMYGEAMGHGQDKAMTWSEVEIV